MTTNTTNTESHFFGTTPFNWATGSTRAEVLKKLGIACGSSILKSAVSNSGGLYAWTCKVNAPADAHYEIEYYKPVGVEWEASAECLIQNNKGYSLPTD